MKLLLIAFSCFHGKIEEVTLPSERVDVIVSEWMGYALLYEGMLDSVIWARDRYLVTGGLMVPSHAVVHLAPVAAPNLMEETFGFWHDVYGFTMESMLTDTHKEAMVIGLGASEVVGGSSPVYNLALDTVKVEELRDFATKRRFTLHVNQHIKCLDGFALWFDIVFTTGGPLTKAPYWAEGYPGVAFTTGPHGTLTHWKQTFLPIKRERPGRELEQWQVIMGHIAFDRHVKGSRYLAIKVDWACDGPQPSERGTQTWMMN